MNNREELFEIAREKASEFTKRLERYDRYGRSHKSLESTSNWVLAISAGTLLWSLGNVDKLTAFQLISDKILILFSVSFLGLSTLIFALVRLLFFLRQVGIDTALEGLEGLPDRVNLNIETKTEEELNEIIARISERSVKLWQTSHNLISHVPSLFKAGWIFYVLGLSIVVIYFAIFLFFFE